MTTRAKRTYNLSAEAIAHVRDLVGRPGAAASQDGVVELAIERLHREIQDQEEAALWSRAAQDPEFRAEMRDIATAFADLETWPG